VVRGRAAKSSIHALVARSGYAMPATCTEVTEQTVIAAT